MEKRLGFLIIPPRKWNDHVELWKWRDIRVPDCREEISGLWEEISGLWEEISWLWPCSFSVSGNQIAGGDASLRARLCSARVAQHKNCPSTAWRSGTAQTLSSSMSLGKEIPLYFATKYPMYSITPPKKSKQTIWELAILIHPFDKEKKKKSWYPETENPDLLLFFVWLKFIL